MTRLSARRRCGTTPTTGRSRRGTRRSPGPGRAGSHPRTRPIPYPGVPGHPGPRGSSCCHPSRRRRRRRCGQHCACRRPACRRVSHRRARDCRVRRCNGHRRSRRPPAPRAPPWPHRLSRSRSHRRPSLGAGTAACHRRPAGRTRPTAGHPGSRALPAPGRPARRDCPAGAGRRYRLVALRIGLAAVSNRLVYRSTAQRGTAAKIASGPRTHPGSRHCLGCRWRSR